MGLLNAALQGVKEIAVPALVGQHVNQQKADILSKRDAMLAKVRSGERAEDRANKVADTRSSQEFKSREAKSDRESREQIAKDNSTAKGGGSYSGLNGQVLNRRTGQMMEVPASDKDIRDRADDWAKAEVENRGLVSEDTRTMKQISDEYTKEMMDAKKAAKAKQEGGGEVVPPPQGRLTGDLDADSSLIAESKGISVEDAKRELMAKYPDRYKSAAPKHSPQPTQQPAPPLAPDTRRKSLYESIAGGGEQEALMTALGLKDEGFSKFAKR